MGRCGARTHPMLALPVGVTADPSHHSPTVRCWDFLLDFHRWAVVAVRVAFWAMRVVLLHPQPIALLRAALVAVIQSSLTPLRGTASVQVQC